MMALLITALPCQGCFKELPPLPPLQDSTADVQTDDSALPDSIEQQDATNSVDTADGTLGDDVEPEIEQLDTSPPECQTASECPTSAEPCLLAACVGNVCGTAQAAPGAACDDTNLCTVLDTCAPDGTCVGHGEPTDTADFSRFITSPGDLTLSAVGTFEDGGSLFVGTAVAQVATPASTLARPQGAARWIYSVELGADGAEVQARPLMWSANDVDVRAMTVETDHVLISAVFFDSLQLIGTNETQSVSTTGAGVSLSLWSRDGELIWSRTIRGGPDWAAVPDAIAEARSWNQFVPVSASSARLDVSMFVVGQDTLTVAETGDEFVAPNVVSSATTRTVVLSFNVAGELASHVVLGDSYGLFVGTGLTRVGAKLLIAGSGAGNVTLQGLGEFEGPEYTDSNTADYNAMVGMWSNGAFDWAWQSEDIKTGSQIVKLEGSSALVNLGRANGGEMSLRRIGADQTVVVGAAENVHQVLMKFSGSGNLDWSQNITAVDFQNLNLLYEPTFDHIVGANVVATDFAVGGLFVGASVDQSTCGGFGLNASTGTGSFTFGVDAMPAVLSNIELATTSPGLILAGNLEGQPSATINVGPQNAEVTLSQTGHAIGIFHINSEGGLSCAE